MRELELRPHPIQLQDISFPEFRFKRNPEAEGPPYLFPNISVHVEQRVDIESRTALFSILVNSVDDDEVEPPVLVSSGGHDEHNRVSAEDGTGAGETIDDAGSKQAVLSFSLVAFAAFSCADFPKAGEALNEFAASDTPALIMWPYIRSFVAEMVEKTGLPRYHLPLAQISTTVPHGDAVTNGSEEVGNEGSGANPSINRDN